MKRNHLAGIALGSVVVGVVVIGAAVLLFNRQLFRLPFLPPPKVEMMLGDDWDTIRAHSTYGFRGYETHKEGF